MHFFISNLLYYLQVDVVDSEYARLTKDIAEARDFQEVLRAHRNFLSTLLRASLVDNVRDIRGLICSRLEDYCSILLLSYSISNGA